MANNRFQLKQFAQNADNNGVFGSYSAGTAESSSDPETIQSLPAWLTGWLNATTSASILPRLEEMQGLQFVLCKAILENTKEGIPSWLPTETYYKYSVCSYYDDAHPFDIYINKTGTWTTTNPAEDTTNWISGGVFFRDKIIPDQSGNDGKVLTTDGINIGWEAFDFSTKANTSMDNITAAGKNTVVGFVITSSWSNYTKFANGLIIQWGYTHIPMNGAATVTLPTPFTTNTYSVTGVCKSGNGVPAGGSRLFVLGNTRTKTTFQIDWTHASHGDDAFWMAIGY